MSLAFRRGISTLIPPKVASPSVSFTPLPHCFIGSDGSCRRFLRQAPKRSGAGGEAHWPVREIPGPVFWEEPKRHAYVVLPQFSAVYADALGSTNGYNHEAIVHVIGFLLVLGYGQAYYFHLRMAYCTQYITMSVSLTFALGHHKNNAH
ncbi:unnamed protein product [Tuber aestivum]|uniref:Uncharacterized protein n=1 Tax=Tuber aestivum TaxID=59557 RepID=A0A292Q9Z2_9PEZI|nr:unnamed protein product [Tuber aestivum]